MGVPAASRSSGEVGEGDDSSFVAFYRREYADAVRLAFLLTGSGEVAEDIVQDVFASLMGRFDELENPSAYLRTAVINSARRAHRDTSRRQVRLQQLQPPATSSGLGDAELLDVVGRLPFRQRTVVVARYWGGWSEAEIATALGCRRGTVKSLASRALRVLRSQVEEEQ